MEFDAGTEGVVVALHLAELGLQELLLFGTDAVEAGAIDEVVQPIEHGLQRIGFSLHPFLVRSGTLFRHG